MSLLLSSLAEPKGAFVAASFSLLDADHGARISPIVDLIPGAELAGCFVDDLSLAPSTLLADFEGVQGGAVSLCSPFLLGSQGDIVSPFSVGRSPPLVTFIALFDENVFVNVENGDLPGNGVPFGHIFPTVIRDGPLLEEKGPVVLSAVASAFVDD